MLSQPSQHTITARMKLGELTIKYKFLRARPKAERVLAEYENFLKLSDPTVTLFSVLYLLNQATD